jgi:hypothetical protein
VKVNCGYARPTLTCEPWLQCPAWSPISGCLPPLLYNQWIYNSQGCGRKTRWRALDYLSTQMAIFTAGASREEGAMARVPTTSRPCAASSWATGLRATSYVAAGS